MRGQKCIWGVLLVILWGICLTSCQNKKTEQTEITLIHGWGTMEQDHVSMRKIYEDFQKENEDIKLNLVSMPSSDEVIRKANDMLAVGKTPDLIFTGGTGIESFYQFMVDKGKAVDLMPYMEADEEFAADIAPELKQYWTTNDNQLFCLSDVLLLSGGYWYNKEMFRQAGIDHVPVTWDEFSDTVKQLQEWGEENAKDMVSLEINSENSMYLADALLLNEDGASAQSIRQNKMTVDTAEFEKMLQRMKDIYSYSNGADSRYSYRDSLNMFNEGKSAIYINGVWAGQMISQNIDTAYALLPAKDGETASCISACLGYMAGDTEDEAKVEASVRFIKYMVSDEVQTRILMETGQVPSNPSVSPLDYGTKLPRLSQATGVVRNADINIQVPENLWKSSQAERYKAKIMNTLNGDMEELEFIDILK